MKSKKKVLFCPLNWGLGHAVRNVPIIKYFLEKDFEVIVASDGLSLEYLKLEFPQIKLIYFPNYKVNYSKSGLLFFKMFLLIPKIIFWTFKEHHILKKIMIENKVHIVISDNRFGLWNKIGYSIFITHQTRVKFPSYLKMFEWIYPLILNHIIRNYDECWIPDFKGHLNLSGDLSHKNLKLNNIFYIGPLSRFSGRGTNEHEKSLNALFILSGPEPQRSLLEKIINDQTKDLENKFALIRGTTLKNDLKWDFPVYDLLNTTEMIRLINQAKIIICRSGYTSIMDLMALKKEAILIPTPGQTEQEYLARHLRKMGLFYSVSQDKFDLKEDLKKTYKLNDLETNDFILWKERADLLNEQYNNNRNN